MPHIHPLARRNLCATELRPMFANARTGKRTWGRMRPDMPLPTLVSQILVPVLFAFALLCAMAGTVIALGLITERDATLRFFSRINAWIPLRARLKWAEVPRDIGRAVLARREWFSTAFIAGGAFIVLSAIVQLSPWWIPGRAPQLVQDVLVDSLVWTMVVGGVLAIVIGVLLAVSPATLAALQAHSDHWISTRQSGRQSSSVVRATRRGRLLST